MDSTAVLAGIEIMDIAVIGSGISGLSAAWYLGQNHRVTLYERSQSLGMDAHTVKVDCGDESVSINTPMRVFFEEYYPVLSGLYQELGVAYEPVKYSGSFSQLHGKTYFRYVNHWLGSYAVPFLAGRSIVSLKALKIAKEFLRLIRQSRQPVEQGSLDTLTIAEYLKLKGHTALFAEQFLYPAFAGICTCSYESVKAYPASIILSYLNGGLVSSRVNRLVHGTEDAATRLAAAAEKLYCGMQLKAVQPFEGGVRVTDGKGHVKSYDHVVIATQANQALKLLPQESAAERAVLEKFRYEKSRIVVHTDEGLAPQSRAEWAPVNFLLSDEHSKPMASIVLNKIHPQLTDKPSIFETWNPLIEPAADAILLDTELERPVVTTASLAAIKQLSELHQSPNRRLWFCGSYANRGIPLLESATTSAKAIAERLNALPTVKASSVPETEQAQCA